MVPLNFTQQEFLLLMKPEKECLTTKVKFPIGMSVIHIRKIGTQLRQSLVKESGVRQTVTSEQ